MNETFIWTRQSKWCRQMFTCFFFHEPPCPRHWFYCNLFFALFCSFVLPFYSVLLHFNKSYSELVRWEFHRATWPLSCKSDLERNANFPRTNEYFKLYDWSFVVENIVQFVIYLDFSKDLFIVKGEQGVLTEPFRGILHQIYRLLTMWLLANDDWILTNCWQWNYKKGFDLPS